MPSGRCDYSSRLFFLSPSFINIFFILLVLAMSCPRLSVLKRYQTTMIGSANAFEIVLKFIEGFTHHSNWSIR
jgi:hypothetical protein